MELIEAHNLTGIVIGAAAFLIIGLFHPLVIKGEYHIGTRCWWIFLAVGIAAIAGTVFVKNTILSSLLGVTGFAALWGIGEVFAQKKRVEKGWFPKNPKRK